MTKCPITGALEGCQEAMALIAKIRKGDAVPDELYVVLQQLRLAGNGEKLRAFVRQIAKAVEGSR